VDGLRRLREQDTREMSQLRRQQLRDVISEEAAAGAAAAACVGGTAGSFEDQVNDDLLPSYFIYE